VSGGPGCHKNLKKPNVLAPCNWWEEWVIIPRTYSLKNESGMMCFAMPSQYERACFVVERA
jgi:hypothetical protein